MRSTIAKRGKNKQKRNDLRQVGLAVVVSKADMIPLFHLSYDGNIVDTVVFRKVIEKLVKRLEELGLDKGGHTIVFDRGSNSKKNLAILKNLGLNYVGALTPYHHKKLIEEAKEGFRKINVSGSVLKFYRAKKLIWGEQRTVVIFISSKLKAGRIRGIYQSLEKIEQSLEKLKASLASPRAKKRDRATLEAKIQGIIKGQYVGNIIDWSLEEVSDGKFKLDYLINYQMLEKIEQDLGFRIIMTNRHSWDTGSIIEAYHGQSRIESAFKNLKNPYHLTIKPQFHWTDDKVRVHMFICVLGYLLATIVWRKVRLLTTFSGTLDTLLDTLNNIRLATVLQESKTPGPVKAIYKLEEMSDMENQIMEALNIKDLHNKRPKIKGVGVYS